MVRARSERPPLFLRLLLAACVFLHDLNILLCKSWSCRRTSATSRRACQHVSCTDYHRPTMRCGKPAEASCGSSRGGGETTFGAFHLPHLKQAKKSEMYEALVLERSKGTQTFAELQPQRAILTASDRLAPAGCAARPFVCLGLLRPSQRRCPLHTSAYTASHTEIYMSEMPAQISVQMNWGECL